MDSKGNKMEYKMKMWKMHKEMIDAMGEKELRAFITGYMMAESKILRKLSPHHHGCGCGHGSECNCDSECSCKHGSCKCRK